jgi:hypothetical protein
MPPGRGKPPALNGMGEDVWGRVYLFSNFGNVYRLEQKAVPDKRSSAKKKPSTKKAGNKQ